MNFLYNVSETVTNNYYFGCTTNKEIRYQASSGGIGIAITRYLLSTPEFGTALTFHYDINSLSYLPLLVHSIDDLNNCGSIYQDINIISFVKENLDKIKGGLIISCPPCQVKSIKSILAKAQINCFIISFSCSGQTTVEGTWKYLQLVGIEKSNVKSIRYRGNGWPSGIQIDLERGDSFYKDNWTSPWSILQNSKLYTPDRCIFCVLSGSYDADISLADPWLDEFIEHDTLGHTLVRVNTLQCKTVLDTMLRDNVVCLENALDKDFQIAQGPNIRKRQRLYRYKKAYSISIKLKRNVIYRRCATYNIYTLIIHNYLQQFIRFIFKSNLKYEKRGK